MGKKVTEEGLLKLIKLEPMIFPMHTWSRVGGKRTRTRQGRLTMVEKRGTMSGCIYCDGTLKCAQAFAAPELRSEIRGVRLPLGSVKVKRGGPAETLGRSRRGQGRPSPAREVLAHKTGGPGAQISQGEVRRSRSARGGGPWRRGCAGRTGTARS